VSIDSLSDINVLQLFRDKTFDSNIYFRAKAAEKISICLISIFISVLQTILYTLDWNNI